MLIFNLFAWVVSFIIGQSPDVIELDSSNDGGNFLPSLEWSADCVNNNGAIIGVYDNDRFKEIDAIKCGYFNGKINHTECVVKWLNNSNDEGTNDVKKPWSTQCGTNQVITALYSENGDKYKNIHAIKCCKTTVNYVISYDNCTKEEMSRATDNGSKDKDSTWNVECPTNHVIVAFYDDENGYGKIDAAKCCLLGNITTQNPTKNPTETPTKTLNINPTMNPTAAVFSRNYQSTNPTRDPIRNPTQNPIKINEIPTKNPSINPTVQPTTFTPDVKEQIINNSNSNQTVTPAKTPNVNTTMNPYPSMNPSRYPIGKNFEEIPTQNPTKIQEIPTKLQSSNPTMILPMHTTTIINNSKSNQITTPDSDHFYPVNNTNIYVSPSNNSISKFVLLRSSYFYLVIAISTIVLLWKFKIKTSKLGDIKTVEIQGEIENFGDNAYNSSQFADVNNQKPHLFKIPSPNLQLSENRINEIISLPNTNTNDLGEILQFNTTNTEPNGKNVNFAINPKASHSILVFKKAIAGIVNNSNDSDVILVDKPTLNPEHGTTIDTVDTDDQKQNELNKYIETPLGLPQAQELLEMNEELSLDNEIELIEE